MRSEHLATPEAFDAFLRGFELGTLPKSEWTHGAHVAAAANYLFDSDVKTVLPLMRTRISAYNLAVGGANTPRSGYHETLTRFWLLIVAAIRSAALANRPTSDPTAVKRQPSSI